MRRSSDRATPALLTAFGISTSACAYGPWETHLKETPLVVAPAEPIYVARQIDVTLEGMTLHAHSTPLCAASKVGEYKIIREDRSVAQVSSRGVNIGLALVGAGITTAGALLLRSDKSDLNVIGGAILPLGISTVIMGSTFALLPRVRRREHAPETFRAVTLAEPNSWVTCGKPGATHAALNIQATGGSESFSIEVSAAPTADLPKDLLAWASWCEVDVELEVTVAPAPDLSTSKWSIMSVRAEQANIEEQGEEHTAPAIRRRLSLGDTPIELGPEAGRQSPVRYQDTRHWTFQIAKPSRYVEPPERGGTRAAELARACRAEVYEQADKQRAEVFWRCIAPMRSRVEEECRTSCTDKKKQRRCLLEHEICLEQTAGIGGAIAEKCDSDRARCLSTISQDASSIDSCTTSCATKAYEAKCPCITGPCPPIDR